MVESSHLYGRGDDEPCALAVRCKLFVANVPVEWTDVDLWRVFVPFGNGCRDVRLFNPTADTDRRRRRTAFVTMKDVASAELARAAVHEQKHVKHRCCDVTLIRPLKVSPYVPKQAECTNKLAADLDKKVALRDVAVQRRAGIVQQRVEPGVPTEVLVLWPPHDADNQRQFTFAVTPLATQPALLQVEAAMLHKYGSCTDQTTGYNPTSCGTLVAVWRPNDNGTGGVWHRARVLSLPFSGGDQYVCDCLDHLEVVDAKRQHIRLLDDCFTAFPAQAVSCRLRGGADATALEEAVRAAHRCFVVAEPQPWRHDQAPLPVRLLLVDNAGGQRDVCELVSVEEPERTAASRPTSAPCNGPVYDVATLERIRAAVEATERPANAAVERRLRQLGVHRDQKPPAKSNWLVNKADGFTRATKPRAPTAPLQPACVDQNAM